MKKHDIKGFATGIIVATLVFSMVGTVFAKSGTVQKELEYNNISVMLDGKKLDLRDANGNAVEPFKFDGTNYLPVRALAETLGLSVAWDGATQTVKLTTPGATPAEKEPEKKPTGKETMGQKNALAKAKTYLDFMAFSYSGLVKQLEFEKFSHDDAVYGADHCGADWNEQAVKKAKAYLDSMSLSKDGLIKQLEFEGFTNAQAVYGAKQNGY